MSGNRYGGSGLKYFVECFICQSQEDDCGHREADLVVWWVNQDKTHIEAVTVLQKLPTVPPNPRVISIATAPDDTQPPNPPVNRVQAVSVRVLDHLKAGNGDKNRSELMGW